jgi:membrane-bound ClpP family serine protease
VNNSHRLGLALFALGVIVFFGERHVLGYINMIASLFLPFESGFYETVIQSYFVIYTISIILLIAGVVMFFKGRRETNLTSTAES